MVTRLLSAQASRKVRSKLVEVVRGLSSEVAVRVTVYFWVRSGNSLLYSKLNSLLVTAVIAEVGALVKTDVRSVMLTVTVMAQ